MKKYFLILLMLSPIVANSVLAAPGVITFQLDHKQKTLTLSEMKASLKTIDVEVYHPVARKRIQYKGFALREVLELGFGKASDIKRVLIKCGDGYQPVLDQTLLSDKGWVLAYADSGNPSLTSFKYRDKNISPGPFYLIGDRARSYLRFGWPYQVVSFEAR